MDIEEFLGLSSAEIAQIIKNHGLKVVVCPINGTRRWYSLEYGTTDYSREDSGYLDNMVIKNLEFYEMFFNHGINTLIVPSFGPDLLQRGNEYLEVIAEGFSRLTTHPLFLEFYQTYDVRVRFYGDYRNQFKNPPFSNLTDKFDALTLSTLNNKSHRLYFGLFAHDAKEAVANFAIEFFQHYGRPPTGEEIVEDYYGEYVEPVDIFIGYDKFSAFDMPLIATGMEDLYFTINPTLYMTENQLRELLYDHIYSRRSEEDYPALSEDDWEFMRRFYQANHEKTLGIGKQIGNVWYPIPQVESINVLKKLSLGD